MRAGIVCILAGLALLLLGGCGVPVLTVVHLIKSDQDGHRFLAPDAVTVQASTPGRYYIWHEYETIYDGRVVRVPESLPDGTTITFTRRDTGEPLTFIPRTNISSSSGQQAKRTIGYIDIVEPAELVLTVSNLNDTRVIHFARSRMRETLHTILLSGAIASTSGAGGLALIIWGIVLIARMRKAA